MRELTVSELKSFDCGRIKNRKFPGQVPVPDTPLVTLDEFFLFIENYESENPLRPKMLFNIEIKYPPASTKEDIDEAAEIMVKTIEKHGMSERSTVQCFVPECLPAIRKLDSRIRTSALFRATRWQALAMMAGIDRDRRAIIRKAVAVGADIISPNMYYVNREFVRECHASGLEVLPWTVNRRHDIIKMLKYGVDGIISDYPDLLFSVYREWIQPGWGL